MNHETLEQAINQWLKENEKGIAHEHESAIAIHAFKDGASWREQQAESEGFDDWWSSVYHESVEWRDWQSCDNLHDNKHNMGKAWQASALHSAKLLAEKDAEIDKAKELIKILYGEHLMRGYDVDDETGKKIKALLGEE